MRLNLFKHVLFFCCLVSLLHAQITNTRKWRIAERDSLDNGLLLYEETNYSIALPIFEKINQAHPKEEFIKYLYGICCLYRSDKYEESMTALSEVYANNTNIDMIEYDLARAYHYNYKFDEAIEMLNKHLSYKRMRAEDKAKGELLKKYVLNAKYYNSVPNKAKVTNAGPEINTENEEYLPVISVDESVMIFNYIGTKSKGGKLNGRLQPDENGIYTSDIYLSKKQDGKFSTPVALDNINTIGNDAAVSLSQDGQILFSYKDITDGHGDIYSSYLIGDNYSQPVKLKGKVNSYSWDGHCSLSPDGRTLYFSSERSGGYGGKDIFKASLMRDSTWGNIVNLGDSINTPYDEDAPFIHSDGTTLFYSSKGLKSTGGYDVFRSTMDLKDSSFKQTVNVGYPINTPDDDIYFVLTASGNKGYYSSGKKGGYGLKDIYLVEPNFEGNKPSLFLVKGNISKNNEVVDAEIKVEVISNNNSIYKKLRSNKGKYLVSLPAGAQYQITYSKADLPSKTLTLTTAGISGYVERIQNVDFDHKLDVVEATHTIAATPTVTIVKVNTPTVTATPTMAITKITTPTVTVAKVNTPTVTATPTVAITKVNTPTVTATPTVAITKVNTPTVTATPTVAITKVNTPTVAITKVNTPTVATTPTVAVAKVITPTVAVTKTTTPIVTSTPTVAVVKVNTPSVATTATPAVTPTAATVYYRPPNMNMENFVPQTAAQEKIKLFTDKYPDIGADSLEFKIQIAAYKNPKSYEFPHLKSCGPIENLSLGDGVTRVTVGGTFKTLRKAYEHNKKVVIAGQNDAFVTVIYKRRRIPLEELETLGIFKK